MGVVSAPDLAKRIRSRVERCCIKRRYWLEFFAMTDCDVRAWCRHDVGGRHAERNSNPLAHKIAVGLARSTS
jgi:hypothetical protein